MIPDAQMITKFQELLKKQTGRDVSREEALEKGTKFFRLVELIYKPMTESEFQKLQERRKQTGDLQT